MTGDPEFGRGERSKHGFHPAGRVGTVSCCHYYCSHKCNISKMESVFPPKATPPSCLPPFLVMVVLFSWSSYFEVLFDDFFLLSSFHSFTLQVLSTNCNQDTQASVSAFQSFFHPVPLLLFPQLLPKALRSHASVIAVASSLVAISLYLIIYKALPT